MNKFSVFLSFSVLLPTLLAGCSNFPEYGRQTSSPTTPPTTSPTAKPDATASEDAENNVNQGNEADSADEDGEQEIEDLDSLAEGADSEEDVDQASYLVKKGDTLFKIAENFSITSKQLQYRNDIENPNLLQVGARLAIPKENFIVPETFLNNGRHFIWPLEKLDISSDFGTRFGRHEGIDLRADRGTEIRAAAEGVVHFSGSQRGYGKIIIIKHAGKVKTLYAHNHRNLVKKGQRVNKGDVIATVGKSGNATGYHVHFEYIKAGRKLNPHLYVYQHKDPDNTTVRTASLN